MADLELPPGPPARDGVLASLRYGASFLVDPFGFVGGRFERYGDVYYAPSGGVGLYVVRHPDHVRDVLVTNADAFEKTHTALEALSGVLGQGLLTTDGAVWRRHRRILGAAFSKKAMDGYVDGMVAEAAVTADRLRDGDVRDVAADTTDLTLRIVGRTLFGIDVGTDVARVGRAMDVFQTVLGVPPSLPRLVRWPLERYASGAIADLDALIARVVRERRAAPRPATDLLQMLVDATDPENPSDRLTEREIRDELVTFLLAGHETTASSLAWTLDLVARHPEVEDAIVAEIDRELCGRMPGSADLDRLVYTERVVKEGLRLYPPAYVLARRAARDTTIGAWSVPRGAEVILWTYFTQRDARFWPEPDAFRPDRFTPEAEAARPKQAYLPFGAGPRACIGRAFAMTEAVAILATLYRTCTFRCVGPPPRRRPRITLRPDGLRLAVRRRR